MKQRRMPLNKCIINFQFSIPQKPISDKIYLHPLEAAKPSNKKAPSQRRKWSMAHASRTNIHFFSDIPITKRLAQLHGADGAVNAYLMNVGVIFGLHVVHMGVEWSEMKF